MILGIDPAIASMGYAIVDGTTVIDYGVITTNKEHAVGDRLVSISRDIVELLNINPGITEVAIEKPMFVGSNTNALAVIMAYGVTVRQLAIARLPYTEYVQASWKKQFTGSGKASKQDVREHLRLLGYEVKGRDDASDALAIALNHSDELMGAAA
ncbi:MAG: crossover junction endodeoxyribonuclease RuvC [Cyanobacteria bacterium P01_E01_bin.6]